MKLNIAFPANGSQKLLEVEDDRKLRAFMEKKMGVEVSADSLGDEWKGYVREYIFDTLTKGPASWILQLLT